MRVRFLDTGRRETERERERKEDESCSALIVLLLSDCLVWVRLSV